MPLNIGKAKTTKTMESAKDAGEKTSVLKKIKGWFGPSKKPRPQPVRQYTYPREEAVRRQPSAKSPTTQPIKRQDTAFYNKFDGATDADRAGFLGWMKALKNYNNALATSKARQRAKKVEKEVERKELARLKAEVAHYYGRPGSMALVDAYNRCPEEQARYEAFLENYRHLDKNVNHAELHARVGPAYIYSPSFGKRKSPPADQAVSPERLAEAQKVLDKSNRERAERERKREAKVQNGRQDSLRPLGTRLALANEGRKVSKGPSQFTVPRKPVPESVAGSNPASAKPKYKAYRPAQKEPEPYPHHRQDLQSTKREQEKPRITQGSRHRDHGSAAERNHRDDSRGTRRGPEQLLQKDSGDGGSKDPSPSSAKASSKKPSIQPSIASPYFDPESFREREKRLRSDRPKEPSRHPTHHGGKELDYSHHKEKPPSKQPPVHPALREAPARQQGRLNPNYESTRKPPSPSTSSKFPIPEMPPRNAPRAVEPPSGASRQPRVPAATGEPSGKNARRREAGAELEELFRSASKPRQWTENAIPPTEPRTRRPAAPKQEHAVETGKPLPPRESRTRWTAAPAKQERAAENVEVSRFSDWSSDEEAKKKRKRLTSRKKMDAKLSRRSFF